MKDHVVSEKIASSPKAKENTCIVEKILSVIKEVVTGENVAEEEVLVNEERVIEKVV